MTYTDFKNKWLGKRVDFDGVYLYQCVDLIKAYMHELHGIPNGAYGNAIDYWTKTHSVVLNKFSKVSGSEAKQGDIVVLNGNTGNPYGHIAIANNLNSTQVEILEQNGSTGNGSGTGGDAIRLRWVSRSRVAGLLRGKVIITIGEQPMTPQEEANAYTIVLNRAMEHKGSNRTGYKFILDAKGELDNQRNAVKSQIQALQTALENEKNKPPKEVIKEVEKIVEKIIEVEKPINEKEVVEGVFKRFWNLLFRKD